MEAVEKESQKETIDVGSELGNNFPLSNPTNQGTNFGGASADSILNENKIDSGRNIRKEEPGQLGGKSVQPKKGNWKRKESIFIIGS